MTTFQDTLGRSWTVAITVQDVKRLRSLLDVDLLALTDDGFKGLGKLLANPITLVDVLFVLVEPQAKAAGVSDESFGSAFSGDVLNDASKAFLEAFADFFPDPRKRAAIKRMFATSEKAAGLLMDRAEAVLDGIDLETEVDRWMKRSGISPASSESTPGPSPSESSS